jgi:hypothetical protein
MTPGGATGAINTQVGNLQGGQQQSGAGPTEGMRLQQGILEGNISAVQKAGDAYKLLNQELNTNKGLVTGIVEAIRKADEKVQVPKRKEKEEGTPPPAQRVEPVPAPPGPPQSRVEPVPRDIGTLGKTGASFEPKDVIALLHKGERVLSPSENADLTNLFGMVSDLKPKSNLGGALSNIKPPVEDTSEVAEEETAESTSNTVADSSGITLKDLNDSLQQLNSNIELMVSHTADMKDSTRETADMSGKLTGNRFAV